MTDLFTEFDVQRLIDHIKANYDPRFPLVLWIDLFCGFGGIAEGYKQVINNFIVAAVNHDPDAIELNILNHPNTKHYKEDIRDWLVIWKLQSLIDQLRKEFPQAYIGLHASLECTYFSIAKGGESRDEDSRTLGYHLEKYLPLKPDYITVENVKEFRKWGPLYHVSRVVKGVTQWKYKEKNRVCWFDTPDKEGYKPFKLPIKERESEDYEKWKSIFVNKGYRYEFTVSNAADFGEHTRRIRYFGVFAYGSLPINFPERTHVSLEEHHLHPHLKVHKPVRDKLNLEDVGVSIFGLNKNGKYYESKTISRVFGGAEKFNGEDFFTSCYYGASQNGQGTHSIDEPLNTITTKDRFALHRIQYAWVFDAQFKNKGSSINKPCPTIIARQDKKPLCVANAISSPSVDNSAPVKGDCKARLQLKKFMRENGITDITIRQLYDYELAGAQGFPSTYILGDRITVAKKFIGHSVCPGHAKANSGALYEGLKNHVLRKAV